ncbi:MAG: hypothetical protein HYU59_06610 [Magnetospirillum gryphiswaldense]|nr:hypothetical protein [Magnetospirillum gryphiswaldense]
MVVTAASEKPACLLWARLGLNKDNGRECFPFQFPFVIEPDAYGVIFPGHVTRFAQASGLTRKHVSNIVHGHASVASETAVDLFDARQKVASNPTVEAGVFAPAAE